MHINVMIVCFMDDIGLWTPMPWVKIPKFNYLSRKNINSNGRVPIKVILPKDNLFPISDYMDEVGALMCFLNSMQCSNVKTYKTNKKEKIKSGAIPFDDYYILTLTNSDSGLYVVGGGEKNSRRKREHLRRGHIRVCSNGNPIWVNAAIINKNKAGGKITKDYKVGVEKV